MILDLEKIKGLEERVKTILRVYLKGKRVTQQVGGEVVSCRMTPEIRRGLDELYLKLDRLQAKSPPSRFIR